jgi:hypothetical protein
MWTKDKAFLTMKPELRIITSPPPPEPPDYARIYKRLLGESMMAAGSSTDWRKRFVYLGIKGGPIVFGKNISPGERSETPDEEMLEAIWYFVEMVCKEMGRLTPNEFMTVFPIVKQYDDDFNYHTTMGELEKIGMDTPIGEHVKMLLFEYYNQHVMKFIRFKMKVVDQIRECRGEPPIMESFLAENGFYSKPVVKTDENGRQFVYDPVKKTTYRMRKTIPDYLSVIK